MKIAILGGGTAGWLTALFLCKKHKSHEIIVVDSEKIGVIGVGESTTGIFTNIISGSNEHTNLNCNIEEFIKETGATLKYSIKHKGWTKDKNSFYQGPIDGWGFTADPPESFFLHALSNSKTSEELISCTQMGVYLNTKKSNFSKEGYFRDNSHAMHIDAFLAGQYFKKKCLDEKNLTHYDKEVVDVELDEKGYVSNLLCSDGGKISADFFIDCSGFNKIIINKLDSKWKSYRDNLPVKAAIPFHLKYQEGEMPKPWTTAWAQSSGWMWQIPLLDRLGCGYVFDDDFITPEQAQEEIETVLNREIEPARVIKFNSGRQESSWIKNCLAIGLSSAFLEPLEATSIHSTLCQIKWFTDEFLQTTFEHTVNPGSIELYNSRVRRLFDDTRDFLVMHYMGGRTDSEFWRYIASGATKSDYVTNLIEMSKSRTPTKQDFPGYFGAAGWGLYSHVMIGIGVLDQDTCRRTLDLHLQNDDFQSSILENEYTIYQQFMYDHLDKMMSYDEFINYFRSIRSRS
jgi:tryptophan halogenase